MTLDLKSKEGNCLTKEAAVTAGEISFFIISLIFYFLKGFVIFGRFWSVFGRSYIKNGTDRAYPVFDSVVYLAAVFLT